MPPEHFALQADCLGLEGGLGDTCTLKILDDPPLVGHTLVDVAVVIEIPDAVFLTHDGETGLDTAAEIEANVVGVGDSGGVTTEVDLALHDSAEVVVVAVGDVAGSGIFTGVSPPRAAGLAGAVVVFAVLVEAGERVRT